MSWHNVVFYILTIIFIVLISYDTWKMWKENQ